MADLHIAQRLEKPVREKIGSCCPELFEETVGQESKWKHPFQKHCVGTWLQ